MTQLARRSAWRWGRRAETRAAWWLRGKGYRIIARDIRTAVGEIDLVARRRGLMIIVEVKARANFQAAAESVTERQRRRIERAAQAFLQQRPALGALDLRFDVVLLVPGQRPRHIEDAWRPEVHH